jgi:hypothetical protein
MEYIVLSILEEAENMAQIGMFQEPIKINKIHMMTSKQQQSFYRRKE